MKMTATAVRPDIYTQSCVRILLRVVTSLLNHVEVQLRIALGVGRWAVISQIEGDFEICDMKGKRTAHPAAPEFHSAAAGGRPLSPSATGRTKRRFPAQAGGPRTAPCRAQACSNDNLSAGAWLRFRRATLGLSPVESRPGINSMKGDSTARELRARRQ